MENDYLGKGGKIFVKKEEIIYGNYVQKKSKNDIIENMKINTIICIGTSTGGPKALFEILKQIPANIKAAIVIVQHMPPGFTKSLAQRLDSICEIEVKEAEQGDILKNGFAYIAPGNYHMTIERGKEGIFSVKLGQSALVSGHRPSADVMFESISTVDPQKVVAIILTGMGSDGTEGLKKIKQVNNGYIIAQDEQTCVVYGMPRSAVQAGIVDVVLPLQSIPEHIIKVIG